LVGPELKEKLGVIRTEELLAARRTDGGKQFFTRANDFGFTKNPEETFQFWDKNKVLSDVVWRFRKFQPDVIIDRFNHRTSGDTHGQHTASALLSVEAFEKSGDPSQFPEQLKYTDAYQPKRLFFNTSSWFYKNEESFEKAKSGFLQIETGVFYPSKGLSNPEIAALSRSNHKTQGFGTTGNRGSEEEYLELIKGKMPADADGIFAGIDTSWNRLKGGKEIGELLAKVEREFNYEKPAASVPNLINAYSLIKDLPDSFWKEVKSEEIKKVIVDCSGLYLEASTPQISTTPSEKIDVNLEAINRSDAKAKLLSVDFTKGHTTLRPERQLKNNNDWKEKTLLNISENARYTTPYWLENPHTEGMYQVDDQQLIGLPETPVQYKAVFNLDFDGTPISVERNIVYKANDPVKGEIHQPLEILPPVSLSIKDEVLMFADTSAKTVAVKITSEKDGISGKIHLKIAEGWKVSPETTSFDLKEKGASAVVNFKVISPSQPGSSEMQPVIEMDGKQYTDEVINLDYGYIPVQTLVLPAKAKLVKLDIAKKGKNIAYIEGVGDDIPESLRQIGYKVTIVPVSEISAEYLASFDAVVTGIRAYNKEDALKYKQPEILAYVKNGGTLVVQYNTTRDMATDQFSPYLLQISHDRVTDENAEVTFLAPDHKILNSPNKITKQDFKGWVQERGLYFPDKWGKEFTPILSMHDKDESPKNSSLLVANYGKGYYIYTGLSFFRQFPTGVPGAFRLFANLLSIGQ
ncbi:MAG: LmbE family protein, partial [Gillisia sp.]